MQLEIGKNTGRIPRYFYSSMEEIFPFHELSSPNITPGRANNTPVTQHTAYPEIACRLTDHALTFSGCTEMDGICVPQ